jgi:putative DNA modification/repair radical SAM protein
MDLMTKLKILGEGATQEQELSAHQITAGGNNPSLESGLPACFTPQHIIEPRERHRNPVRHDQRFLPGGIHTSPLPGGGSTRLLKVLQTNICEFDCFYCEHRASRDVPRTYVSPDELARTFMMLHQKRLVDGLFLSSGITKRIDVMQERMVQTVEILRNKYHFKGYVHLKILPGASQAAVERTMQLANRVSLNLEAPSPQHLLHLSRKKDFLDGMLTRMVWVKRLQQQNPNLVPAGQITQFVVGAAGETDRDILGATNQLYKQIGLRRAYFSAFSPIQDTPLDHLPPTPLLRQNRLYQADWLLRFYGFKLEEIPLTSDGNLIQEVDPKTAWAMSHPEWFPLELSIASYEELLRVPGIGPTSAKRIVETRHRSVITDPREFTHLGMVLKRAAPYILYNGRPLTTMLPETKRKPSQLDLWSASSNPIPKIPLTQKENPSTIRPIYEKEVL